MIDNQPKLLTNILNHLASSNEARERFNSISESIHVEIDKDNDLVFVKLNSTYSEYWNNFWRYDIHEKKSIIQTALSNTPDGQPVCGFLRIIDKSFKQLSKLYPKLLNENKKSFDSELVRREAGVGDYFQEDYQNFIDKLNVSYYLFLNGLLYETFTTALFHSKDFETALEETNQIYLENLKS